MGRFPAFRKTPFIVVTLLVDHFETLSGWKKYNFEASRRKLFKFPTSAISQFLNPIKMSKLVHASKVFSSVVTLLVIQVFKFIAGTELAPSYDSCVTTYFSTTFTFTKSLIPYVAETEKYIDVDKYDVVIIQVSSYLEGIFQSRDIVPHDAIKDF